MDMIDLVLASAGFIAGILSTWVYHRSKLGSYEAIAQSIIQKAEYDAADLKRVAEFAAKQKQLEQQRDLELFSQNERKKIEREEERLIVREDKLEARMNLIEKKLRDTEKRDAILIARRAQVEEEKQSLLRAQQKLTAELETITGLSVSQAKDLLIAKVSGEVQGETANFIRRARKEAEEEAERIAGSIVATAINRLAVSCASETTVHTVTIPNDEMKGRIIGREGRNIRALEQETGINFIIDDTPGAVVLSGFDPVRMHIAKSALQELVADGRIHPTRIEEAVSKARQHAQKQIKQHGEDAAFKTGVTNLHPEIISLLGKLKFRYSYGQNILDHSIEVSHLLGLMAAELGLDVKLAKRIGLLHDMGKAISHEVEGTHAVLGHDIALRCGESRDVANGIGCHHQEMEPSTIEGSLCSAADAISASRPGARIEAVEEYIKRLRKLEEIAGGFTGVEKAYAMQAGREVRIVVLPELIDDAGVVHLARDLTKRIEKELSYPGKIKVTVIREKRAVEYAL